jgi:DNA polymerase III epsilon subunit-like protein
MFLINQFVETRLTLINSTEKKEEINDVIFTLNLNSDKIEDANIYLIPFELSKANNKNAESTDIVINFLLDKSFFIKNSINDEEFNVALFFSFDINNMVDTCYAFYYSENILRTSVFDNRGNELVSNEREFEFQEVSTPNIEAFKHRIPYYLFFDTETTGLLKNWNAPITAFDNWPRLVQLAFITFDIKGNKLNEGNYIIKPDGFKIPNDASNVHNISNEKALREGLPLEFVLRNFQFLVNQVKVLVAHNISFDEKIIGAEFLRTNMSNPLPKLQKICTMESTTNFCRIEGPYGYKWPKLSELYYKLFNKTFMEAHDASVDIKATALCFWELKNRNIL